jgi:hypothetical protein
MLTVPPGFLPLTCHFRLPAHCLRLLRRRPRLGVGDALVGGVGLPVGGGRRGKWHGMRRAGLDTQRVDLVVGLFLHLLPQVAPCAVADGMRDVLVTIRPGSPIT